jgi:hypothetical protein
MQKTSNYVLKQIILNKYNSKLLFILSIKKLTINLLNLLWSIQYIIGYTSINTVSVCIYLQKNQYKLKNLLFIKLKNKFKNNIKFKKLYAINSIQPNLFILLSNKYGLTIYNLTQKDGGIILI